MLTVSRLCGLTAGGSGVWSTAATNKNRHSKNATANRSFTFSSNKQNLGRHTCVLPGARLPTSTFILTGRDLWINGPVGSYFQVPKS
jgi:hypothetical protein